jgi:hypothetical protein
MRMWMLLYIYIACLLDPSLIIYDSRLTQFSHLYIADIVGVSFSHVIDV